MSIALLDVDGVLANFSQYVIDTAGVNMTLADITQWDLFSLMGDKGREAKRCLKDPNWWSEIQPMPGAQRAIERIRENYHVVAITAPWLSCIGWGEARRFWLDLHFDIEPRDVIIASQKELVRGALFIDDKPETVKAWHLANPNSNAFLFDAAYNQNCGAGFERLYGWEGFGG